MWNSIQVFQNQAGTKSIYMFEILNYDSPMQSYIKHRVKLWEQIEFKSSKSVSTVFLGTLTVFRCISHSVRLHK